MVHVLPCEDDKLGPVHRGGVADPADRPRAEAEDLDTGAQAEHLERADVRSVEIKLAPRGVAQHD